MYGRRNYADDDADHLPAGMRRVGYDDETQRYTFRKGNDLWLGEPGSYYGGQMKWAGRTQDAVGRSDDDEGELEESHPDSDDDPVPPYERDPIPPPKAGPQGKGEWGVPVHAISETGARPIDSDGVGATLKRRASRFKQIASNTIVAQRVLKRFAGQKRDTEVLTQKGSTTDVGIKEGGESRRSIDEQ